MFSAVFGSKPDTTAGGNATAGHSGAKTASGGRKSGSKSEEWARSTLPGLPSRAAEAAGLESWDSDDADDGTVMHNPMGETLINSGVTSPDPARF